MLRAARDRCDTCLYVLLFGNSTWDDVLFREEIEEMELKMKLKVVHCLTEPPDDWDGEEGYVDKDVLDKHLPKDIEKYAYFICGPGALLDLVEPDLRARGVPASSIHTERFDMV